MLISVIAQLSAGVVLALLSEGQWQLSVVGATLLAIAVSSVAMFKRRRTAFSLSTGALLVFQCCAFVLVTNLGFIGAWGALGIGLACLLVGNQALVSSGLYVGASEEGLLSKEVVIATRRSFWRILLFVGLVMACSMLVLFLILAMDLGSLTLPFLLVAGLLLMVSLYYLATRGTTTGDGEKPNI